MAASGSRPEGTQQQDPGDDDGTAESGGAGRERDPGDAVPPGVAPLEPPEPTEEDLRVLEKLRDLPHRGGDGG